MQERENPCSNHFETCTTTYDIAQQLLLSLIEQAFYRSTFSIEASVTPRPPPSFSSFAVAIESREGTGNEASSITKLIQAVTLNLRPELFGFCFDIILL